MVGEGLERVWVDLSRLLRATVSRAKTLTIVAEVMKVQRADWTD